MPPAIDEWPRRPALRMFPWLRMARALGLASDPRALVLALVGMLLLGAGWSGIDRMLAAWSVEPITPEARLLPALPEPRLGSVADQIGAAAWHVSEPYRLALRPFTRLFRPGGGADLAQGLLAGLWAIVVFAPIGAAISRMAVVRLAEPTERVGLLKAVRFALGRLVSLIVPPLSPLLLVAVLGAVCASVGLLYRLGSGSADTAAGWLGVVPLLAGLAMALVLLGLAGAWPLMVLTVTAEGEDGFDALSRSYAYTTQKPVRYAAYALLAWAVGTAGLAFVWGFARLVLALATWGLALGAPRDRVAEVETLVAGGPWATLVAWLAQAWAFSFFWAAAAIIYLLLRRDVDGTPWHDVYFPEHDFDTFDGRPAESAAAPASEPAAQGAATTA